MERLRGGLEDVSYRVPYCAGGQFTSLTLRLNLRSLAECVETQAGVDAVGEGYVFHDLGAQKFGGIEFLFFADVLQEADFDSIWSVAVEWAQQESFDGQTLAFEGRAVTDVGD